jgi:hypothetical protein
MIGLQLPPCPGTGREARTAPAWEAARRAWTEEMPPAPKESYCSRLSPATGQLKAGYSTASQRCFSVCPPTNLAAKHQRHPLFHRGVAKALHIVGRAYRSPVGRHYNTYITSSLTLFLAGIPVTGAFTLKGSITSCRGQVSKSAIAQIGYGHVYINVCHDVSREYRTCILEALGLSMLPLE